MSVVEPSAWQDREHAWWLPAAPDCFLCGEDTSRRPAVYWHGYPGVIVLCPPCAERLGVHLIADSREAALMGGSASFWRTRALRAVRERLTHEEGTDDAAGS